MTENLIYQLAYQGSLFNPINIIHHLKCFSVSSTRGFIAITTADKAVTMQKKHGSRNEERRRYWEHGLEELLEMNGE